MRATTPKYTYIITACLAVMFTFSWAMGSGFDDPTTAAFVVGQPILLITMIGACRAVFVAAGRSVVPLIAISLLVTLANIGSAFLVRELIPNEEVTIYWAAPAIASVAGTLVGAIICKGLNFLKRIANDGSGQQTAK